MHGIAEIHGAADDERKRPIGLVHDGEAQPRHDAADGIPAALGIRAERLTLDEGDAAMTEPGSGSDALALRTRAHRHGDRWLLDGSKTFVTNGPVADVFVVFASTDPSARWGGITAFLIERDTPGLIVGQAFDKMGLRTSPMSELVLDGCAVGDNAVLGKPGNGLVIFTHSMEWERSCILAAAVGTMERSLERCVAYAREREQFGQPIGGFQAVSHRIVDMKVRLEAGRLLLYRLGWLKAQGRRATLEASLVKLYLSEAWVASSLDALQVHGGYGYMTESGLERDVRDAIGSRIYSGTSEIQKNLIARQLGL